MWWAAVLLCAAAPAAAQADDPQVEWLKARAERLRQGGMNSEAQETLREALDLAPDDESIYQALSELYGDEERQAPRAGADLRVVPQRVLAPSPPRSALSRILTPISIAGLAVVIAGLLTLLLGRLRSRGDLAVAIEPPPDRRGTFSVRLSQRRPRNRRAAVRTRPVSRASSRFEHNLIARETHFRGIPARDYWIVIEGILESEGEEPEGIYQDREVRVLQGQSVRELFDLSPRGCPVDVEVVRSGTPVPGARVALGGDPTSLRLAREGSVRLTLPEGDFVLLAGSEDRAAEQKLHIESFEPTSVRLDLDDLLSQAFADCPGAVEPFLRGDLSVAAAALEKAGQFERGQLLAARFHEHQGETAAAAERYEQAGRLLEAAELRGALGDFAASAELFERAGDPARAAEMHNAAGDLVRAGQAYEEAGDLEGAIVCFREAEAGHLLIGALEKKGEIYEAGELALSRGETQRAVRNFQQVGASDPGYFRACRVLADTFHKQGKLELAVQKADEAVTFSRQSDNSPDTFVWYGDLLEKSGRPERALATFEELASRHPQHPNLATRIEALRKRLTEASEITRPSTGAFGSSSRYEIGEEIGSGGMGVVYRARDKRLGREVALKRLPDKLKDHPKAVELFLREARAAAALNHPNIVTVHDVDQEDGLFFITMELLVGTTLLDVLRSRGALPALDAARLGLHVATGLAYAHSRRIIHRDIKTANLFLTQDRIVKIMDFGLAKTLEEVRKAETAVGGTPYYMSPEQSLGEGVDHRTDLYSLGVTLFELVTVRRPFAKGDIPYHHRNTPAPDARHYAEGLPDAMAELILRLMAKSPDQRPQTADAVAQELKRIATGFRSAQAELRGLSSAWAELLLGLG